MSWAEWLTIWAIALAATGIIVGLGFLMGVWALLVVFPVIIVGGGYAVTRT